MLLPPPSEDSPLRTPPDGRKETILFENFKRYETDFAGRPLVIETGKMAQLANGECLVRYGDTVVHVAATASAKPRDGIDFFPLSVDFEIGRAHV